MTPSSEDLRCSVITHELGERPAGSAGGADRYLLVELPLPWPKKIDSHPLLTDVIDPAPEPGGFSHSILGIRSTDDVEIGVHRIICYERSAPFRGFERTEAMVPTASLASTVTKVLARGGSAFEPSARVEVPHATEDLLLCTHGSRDRCCGQLGTLLHIELDCALPPNVRMWRTSHTGGHRFAPTGIHFPSGTAWAYLDAELTQAIVNRSIGTTNLGRHYRGNVGITGRPSQIAEGLAFLDAGWSWLDEERSVEVESKGSGEYVVSVTSGAAVSRFRMIEEGSLPVPICGEGVAESIKSTPQFRVTDRS